MFDFSTIWFGLYNNFTAKLELGKMLFVACKKNPAKFLKFLLKFWAKETSPVRCCLIPWSDQERRFSSICTLVQTIILPHSPLREKYWRFFHFRQHSQHKPGDGLPARQTYWVRGIRGGVECDGPQGRQESRTQETTQCLSKPGQQQESVQRAQDDAILSAWERVVLPRHITGEMKTKKNIDRGEMWHNMWREGRVEGAGWAIDCVPLTDYFPHTR